LFSQNGITYKSDSLTAKIRIIKADPDDDNKDDLYVTIRPNINESDNISVLTPDGSLVIGEDGPCHIAGNTTAKIRLMVKGAVQSDNISNFVEVDAGSNFGAGRLISDYDISMDKLRRINTYTETDLQLALNDNELLKFFPESIKEYEYNGEKVQVFNSSQLIYNLLGAVRFLDDQQLAAKQQLQEKETQIQLQASKIKQLEAQLKKEQQKNDKQDNRLEALENLILNNQSTNTSNERKPVESRSLEQEKIILFPNPSTETLNIKLSDQLLSKNSLITITDLTGKMILSVPVNNRQLIPLDLKRLGIGQGAYYCNLVVEGEIAHSRQFQYFKK